MKDEEIDEILKRAAAAPHSVDPVLLDKVSASMGASMSAVRPMRAAWVLEIGLVLVCVAVAIAGAAKAGFYGIEDLSGIQRGLIFPLLAVFTFLAASVFVREMIPGSRRSVAPAALLGFGCAALLAAFAILFRDYHTDHFLSAGLICLAIGLLHAIPTGLLSWLILRRGFAVNSAAAGIAAGTLAGLAGVTMLELHCPILQAWHILVWHTAVIPVSAAGCAYLGWRLSGGKSSGTR